MKSVRRLILLTAILAALLVSPGLRADDPSEVFVKPPPGPTDITDQQSLLEFLGWLDRQVESTYADCSEQMYKQSMNRPAFLMQSAFGWFGMIFDSNRKYASTLSRLLPSTTDPVLKRQMACYLEWLRLSTAPVAVSIRLRDAEEALQDELYYVEPEIDGREVKWSEIDRILETSPNRSRRQKAYKAVYWSSLDVDDAAVQLIRAQNRLARSLGYNDYAEMSLKRSGLSREDALHFIRELDRVSREPYKRWLDKIRDLSGIKDIKPWDIGYMASRKISWAVKALPVSVSRKKLYALASTLGFKPKKLHISIETADITYLGLTWPVKIPGDTRIICLPGRGLQYHRTLFHEYGHALHFSHIDKSLPFILKIADPLFYSESMAEVFCQLSTAPQWLRHATRLPSQQIKQLDQAAKLDDLRAIRSFIAHTEYAMYAYANPDADLRKAHRRIYEHAMMINYSGAESGTELLSLVSDPLIGFNHAISKALAAQIVETVKKQAAADRWLSPETGKFIINSFYKDAGSRSWKDKLKAATGCGLDMQPLAHYLQGAQ